MYKDFHAFRRQSFEELTRLDFVAFEALELTHRPCHKPLIDISQQGIQRRGGIAPIVRNPSAKERIEFLGNVLQGQLRLTPYVQVPDRLAHGLHCRGADCWIESSKHGVAWKISPKASRKQYPRKSNLTFGYLPFRFPSLQ